MGFGILSSDYRYTTRIIVKRTIYYLSLKLCVKIFFFKSTNL